MMCCYCEGNAKKHGKAGNGEQRYRCRGCRKTFIEEREKPLGDMRIPEDKAILALKLLVEGTSIRSTERLTGMHRDTIMRLMVMVGEKCERFMAHFFKGLQVHDVQADELWGFVRMKERTKKLKDIEDHSIGDAYIFVALERGTKAVIAWHMGHRDGENTNIFMEKVAQATTGNFHISTDGWTPYPEAIRRNLGDRVTFGTVVKQYDGGVEGQGRYSPAEVVKATKRNVFGQVEDKRICTSHIERSNLTWRMTVKRLARLTMCFSKKRENLRASLALTFAFYNLCRKHATIKCTPAMESKMTDHVWTMEELLATAATF